jgi:hypothetical protein
VLREIRRQHHHHHGFTLQYQGPDTSWKSVDRFDDDDDDSSFEGIALFPAAGNIGMVRRKMYDNEDTNCILVIHKNDDDGKEQQHHHRVGVTIELVATKDIRVGDTLVLDLPTPRKKNQITREEYWKLYKELKLTGQTNYNPIIFQYAKQLPPSQSQSPQRRQQKQQQTVVAETKAAVDSINNGEL